MYPDPTRIQILNLNIQTHKVMIQVHTFCTCKVLIMAYLDPYMDPYMDPDLDLDTDPGP